MAEVLLDYDNVLADETGTRWRARAWGRERRDGDWEGWIEFLRVDGGGSVHTSRETTQPNRTDTLYWATGLSAVYLEGALNRALDVERVEHPPAR